MDEVDVDEKYEHLPWELTDDQFDYFTHILSQLPRWGNTRTPMTNQQWTGGSFPPHKTLLCAMEKEEKKHMALHPVRGMTAEKWKWKCMSCGEYCYADA